MDTGSNKKWTLVAAAVLIVSVPAGLWVSRSSILKSGSTGSSTGATQGASSSQQTPAGSSSQSSSGKSDPSGKSSHGGAVVAGGGSSQGSGKQGDTRSGTGATPGAPQAGDSTQMAVGTPGATTGGVAVPGTQVGQAASGTGVTAPGTQTAKVEAPKEPEGCVTFAYRHKKASGHTSDDACSHHKNLIQLKHVAVNPSTVCVRVNKRPVAFQTVKGHADQILIGAVAGPNTDITVRYCLGKTKCSEDCAIPKDEFLSAIGGSEIEGGGKVAQWDPAEAEKEADVNGHLDKDIKNELERLDEARPDSRMAAVFQDWIAGQETAACGTASSSRQAMK